MSTLPVRVSALTILIWVTVAKLFVVRVEVPWLTVIVSLSAPPPRFVPII